LEGIPAIVCGVLTYFLLPSRPAEAKFLTQDEKDWITAELAHEEKQKLGEAQISVVQALANGRVWQLACVLFTLDIGQYSMSFWMPQVVRTLSSRYSNTVVGILVMIPYVVGVMGMILVSRSSDHRLERRLHAAIPAIVGGIALMLLGTSGPPLVLHCPFGARSRGYQQLLWPFLLTPERVLNRILSRGGHSPD
jgi:ACS family tartrate transporter-like MFS transporter